MVGSMTVKPAKPRPRAAGPARSPRRARKEAAGGAAVERPEDGIAAEDRKAQHLRRLGEAVLARREDVLHETVERTRDSGEPVDPSVQESFERICTNSTTAVARWIAGDGLEVTNDSARETSHIFGELAARRAASLQEVTRRMFWWRNVFGDVMREEAAKLKTPRGVLRDALDMLQLSVEFSLLRMCQCFERERRRTDEQLASREEELAFMATHDPLTDLPNRTLIVDRIEQMLARSARQQTSVAALFVDLDNFKAINDTLGHAVGDQLLQAVAARLHGVVREVDALGRLGGDEFVVLVGDLAADASPVLVAERLLDALKQPFKLGEGGETTVTIGASIGIAMGEGASAGDLLRDADIAMYRAKWDGRNRFAMYESGMQDVVQERMELEMDLREALAREQFFLAYQPTLDLADMRPTGVEALIRWRHPERGVVQPNNFIPLLEETGLITEVGRWVLAESCRQGAEWLADGHEISMAVNVSGRQLDSDQLIEDIRDALADSGLPPEALTIEITETTLMRDVEQTARRLGAIKDLGVRIAIDDFGTGYSSLAHLQRFPVDALKIDRSFVSGLSRNKEGETLIQTLVQLGKALSIETFAEGIEQQQELTKLREQDCDNGQGFLFARPLEPADAALFLRDFGSRADS
jgi:diguanylate cyclase (GGDEF)-like protein